MKAKSFGAVRKKILFVRVTGVLLLLLTALTSGCAFSSNTVLDTGELVRHYFGYVKVITPAIHAPDAAVRVLSVESYGIWLYTDTRQAQKDPMGLGAGLGYKFDHREYIPLDCRLVIRVKTREELEAFLEAIGPDIKNKEGICVIQDSSI